MKGTMTRKLNTVKRTMSQFSIDNTLETLLDNLGKKIIDEFIHCLEPFLCTTQSSLVTEYLFFGSAFRITKNKEGRLIATYSQIGAENIIRHERINTVKFEHLYRLLHNNFMDYYSERVKQDPVVAYLIKRSTRYLRKLDPHSANTRIGLQFKHRFLSQYRPDNVSVQKRYQEVLTKVIYQTKYCDAVCALSDNEYNLPRYNDLISAPHILEFFGQSPNLLPLWYRINQITPYLRRRNNAKSVAFNLKQFLSDHYSLTNKAWQKMSRMNIGFFKSISELPIHEICLFVNVFSKINFWPNGHNITLLQESGVLPLLRQLFTLKCYQGNIKQHTAITAIILKHAEEHAGNLSLTIIDEYMVFLRNYLQRHPIYNKNQLNHGYELVGHELERFRLIQLALVQNVVQANTDAANTAKIRSWQCPIKKLKISGYRIIPLVDENLLYEEGREMSHCVHNYTDECVNGNTLIFSIRQKQTRLATVQYKRYRTSALWHMVQIKGPKNASVPTALLQIGEQVCSKLNVVSNKN